MKQYLIDTFRYNDVANRTLLKAILQLPESAEAIQLFSHLIYAQDKWRNRVVPKVDDASLSWSGTSLPPALLESSWTQSVNAWIALLDDKSEADLEASIIFSRATDGKQLSVKLRDIALQLNYHAIHHRAQINKLISAQGHDVPPTDYILSVLREV